MDASGVDSVSTCFLFESYFVYECRYNIQVIFGTTCSCRVILVDVLFELFQATFNLSQVGLVRIVQSGLSLLHYPSKIVTKL